MDILIGSDPEFFVRRADTNELVSAYGMIEGTKAKPVPMGPGHAQVDGMALEINVPPAKTAKEFTDNFNGVMDALKKEVGPNYVFDFSPVAHFGAEVIAAQPLVARELGCEPDFSAYTGKANPRPNADTPFRTASGHIHIGWTAEQDTKDPDHIEACNMLSKQLDYFIGLPSLIWDEDVTRRQLYGKAGCYRPKHYGMEYRTLSNAWLTDTKRIEFVVSRTIEAFKMLVDQNNYGNSRQAPAFINEGDWVSAWRYYTDGPLDIPRWLRDIHNTRNTARMAEIARQREEAEAAMIAKMAEYAKGQGVNPMAKDLLKQKFPEWVLAELVAGVPAADNAAGRPWAAKKVVVQPQGVQGLRGLEGPVGPVGQRANMVAWDDVVLEEEDF